MFRVLQAAAAALCLCGALARAAPLDSMLALDAVYIPALALTSSAAKEAAMAPRAEAAVQRLQQQWPALRRQLAAVWPADAKWARELDAVQRQIARGDAAVRKRDWTGAHDALEDVRLVLMRAREVRGMRYYVDRLTAYHEPMEALALAGSTLKPEQVTTAKRQELDRAYVHARALWLSIEREPIDAKVLALSPQREKQLRQAIADESAALTQLSEALHGSDTAKLLKAAAAIKPPFARTFTAFGQADGETGAPRKAP